MKFISRIAKPFLSLVLLSVVLFGCGKNDKKPLRICVDFGPYGNGKSALVENFLFNTKEYGISDNVEFEIVPPDEAERKGALTKLRTEIAAGTGPDVFIIDTSVRDEELLFRFPIQAMEQGRFLKLDDYIANAKNMEWNMLYAPIMSAGKTEKGQFLIPMAYTFPVTLYNGDAGEINITPTTTWGDMVDSPNKYIREAAAMFDPRSVNRICSVFGEIANYQTEQILFSEEDLLGAYEMEMQYEDEFSLDNQIENYKVDMSVSFDFIDGQTVNWDFDMVPLCNMFGGVTATITAYCGINANTKHPDEAFTLIDVLLSKSSQQNSDMYGAMLNGKAIPVYNELMQESTPVQRWHMKEDVYQNYLEARELITQVKFRTPLDSYLTSGYADCTAIKLLGEGDIPSIAKEIYRQMTMELAES